MYHALSTVCVLCSCCSWSNSAVLKATGVDMMYFARVCDGHSKPDGRDSFSKMPWCEEELARCIAHRDSRVSPRPAFLVIMLSGSRVSS